MTQHARPFESPFTLAHALNAARVVLGVDTLPKDIATEVRRMTAGYLGRLRRLQQIEATGGRYRSRDALHRVQSSLAAKTIAFLLAYPSSRASLTWAQVKSQSERVNPLRPSGERVISWEEAKRKNGARTICSFGPVSRAAQQMVSHIIFVVAGPSPYEFAQSGRGRDAAARITLHSIKHKGVRWFGLADVKDCFPSISREMVKQVLPFLPSSIIDGTIFIHNDTDIKATCLNGDKANNKSVNAIRKSLPQGSLVSLLVASKVLQPHLDALNAPLVIIHVDNVMIGAKTEEQIQANLTALTSLIEKASEGSLQLISEVRKFGDPEMDFLGYRFRRGWMRAGGFGRAYPANRSFRQLHYRLARMLLLIPDTLWTKTIEQECARWIRSFPAWTGRFRSEYFAILNCELDMLPMLYRVRFATTEAKCVWASFSEMTEFVSDTANVRADQMPRLFTEGGSSKLLKGASICPVIA